MTRDELLAEFRSVVDDTAGPPYAWSDARALTWLSEGQDIFCEKTGFWTDATTYHVTTVENQYDYPYDSRIIEIKEVWDGDRRLSKFIQYDRPRVRSVNANGPLLPNHWQADKETGVLTLYDAPTGGVTLALHVWRYSKVALTHKNNAGAYDTQPEIPARFHLALVEYAAAKAFGDHDRERQDPVKARDHMIAFERYCHDGEIAFERLNAAPVRVEPARHYVV